MAICGFVMILLIFTIIQILLKQGVKIGAYSTVGAGAVVVNDVPDGVTVVGIPARPMA